MQIKEINVSRSVCFNIGQQYSNEILVIHFKGLPDLPNKYIYVKKGNYEKEVPLVGDLYVVSRPLTTYSGEVKAQIIARDPGSTPIALTPNFNMMITPSNYSGVGEDENYPDDPNIKNYYVKIDGKIQSMDELIALVQSKLDNGEFVGAQGPKGEKGEPGEKGDPGSVTKEFKDLASQIAQNATNAQASATNAQTSASNAQEILDDTKDFANQAKSELNQIKADTNTLKEEANTSAVNAKASETKAKEYADNLQASIDDISQLKEDLVANSKEDAKTKRSLSALWDLNNGISYRFETDSEKAYQKQIPSGAKLGSVNKVGGKTIVMNQMFNHKTMKGETMKGVTFTNNGDGTYTANGVPTENVYLSNIINIIKGHTYYIRSLTTVGSNITYKAYITGSSTFNNLVDYGSGAIEKARGSGNAYFIPLYIVKGVTVNDLKIVPQVYDLTKMFGSGNEPSTTQEFEAMFPNDYYPYNEGELMSMSVNDVVYTDTSSNQTSHPIPQSILSLDGYGWSAGTAYNYVDFENKKYYKCVDKVDLGTLNYFSNDNTSFGTIGMKGYKLTNNYDVVPNVVCKKYETKSQNQMWGNKGVTGISVNAKVDGYLYINDLSFSDAKLLKNALQGVYLYYELAEPIVTDISDIIDDTFQEPFVVESGGSLTFKNTNGDGYRIAVPSDIQYVVALSEVNS